MFGELGELCFEAPLGVYLSVGMIVGLAFVLT